MMMSQRKTGKPSPRLEAGPIGRLIFWWLRPLVNRGKKYDLTNDDLHDVLPSDLSEKLGSRLERYWKEEVENARRSERKPELVKALQRGFGYSYLYYAGPMLVLNCLRLLQPLVLGLLIGYFEPGSKTGRGEAYFYGIGLAMLSLLHSLLKHHVDLGALEIGMRLRIACSSLIYRKVVRLSSASATASSAGQIINLLSNDVARFDPLFLYLHYIWLAILQGCLVSYLAWRRLGLAALAGILLMALETLPVQLYVGKITSKLRGRIASRTDERVRLMGEIISGIHVIKMYTWEKPFEYLVSLARRREIKAIQSMSYLRGVNIAASAFVDRTCLYFTLLVYVLGGHAVTAERVFPAVQYFTILQILLAYNYPRAIFNVSEAHVSVGRIETFLLMEEIRIRAPLLSVEENGSIALKAATASWSTNSIVNTLHDITMYIAPKKLHVIVGPIGSGKSSLLQLMLGELRSSSGELRISGTISYAAQRPWLFPGTLRDNIVFDQVYDEARYEEVLRVCALNQDLARLGRIAERGVNLSGGQRARINLARAVYRDADIYVLDEPFAALDPNVCRHIYDNCVNGFLKDKTRILVTHQVRCLKQADTIFLLNNGKLEAQGKFTDFSEKQLRSLNVCVENDDEDENKENRRQEEGLTKETVPIETKAEVDEQNHVPIESTKDKEPQETEELLAKGKMRTSIFSRYFCSGNSGFLLLTTFILFVLAQTIRSGSDYWLAYWTRQEELHLSAISNPAFLFNATTSGDLLSNLTATTVLIPSTTESSPTSNTTLDSVLSTASTLLSNVTESSSTAINLIPISNSTIVDSISTTIASALLKSNVTTQPILSSTSSPLPRLAAELASNSSSNATDISYLDADVALLIYGCILIGCVVTAIVKVLLLYRVCMNASRAIHGEMFGCVLRAPMRFFDRQTSGQVLNRFSKDTGSMDEVLPVTLHEAIEVFSVIVGVVGQVLFVDWRYIIPMAMIGLLYWRIQGLCVPTAYRIKRLEGAAKSPVLSHVTATLEGLATIRSSRGQTSACRRFDSRQDAHTRAHFLGIAVASAFGLWLDLATVCLVAIVAVGCISSTGSSTVFAGSVGLVITQVIMLCGMLQRGIRQTAESVTQMTSVERILQFTELEKETEEEEKSKVNKPPATWPSRGKIEFRNFSLSYGEIGENGEPALREVNLVIQPGSRVGIVGRTGSGKSSLVTALFRLARAEGELLIDDLNTGGLGLTELRRRIAAIPQEPVLFSASLRDNLDPHHEHEDTRIWAALEDVRLHKAFVPLDHPIECGGRNLSAGQRQLLCLARALVKRARILVLDEATANVDPTTDALIRETIRVKFAGCTVLTVAHRLDSVVDCDLVVVVDAGRIVESGHPHLLLEKSDGQFVRMAQQAGDSAFEHLRRIAEETYTRHNNQESISEVVDEEHISANGSVKSDPVDKTAHDSAEEL